jgi:hypothetical protein
VNKEQTIELVRQAYATYNQAVPELDTKDIYRAWYDLLHDLDYEQAKAAFLDLATYERFMPRPGDIRRRTIDSNTKIPVQLDAYSAWGMFQTIIKNANSGTHTNVQKPDALIKVLEQLGEAAWGMHTNGDRDVFVRTYERVVSEMDKEKYAIKPAKEED